MRLRHVMSTKGILHHWREDERAERQAVLHARTSPGCTTWVARASTSRTYTPARTTSFTHECYPGSFA